jgi:hypothetical protein
MFFKEYRKYRSEERASSSDGEYAGIWGAVSAVFFLIHGIIAYNVVPTILTGFFNPEFYVIQKLLNKL